MRTFKKTLEYGEVGKTSYVDIVKGCYSETIVDDDTGYPEPGGWYDIDDEEEFIISLLEMGYEVL